jgi:putative flippase GtrA
MTSTRVATLVAAIDRRAVTEFMRYGLSGATAVATLMAVLAALVELAGSPATPASVVAFGCATLVNYSLQHSFVFGRSRGHAFYLPRYLAVTAATMTLNALLFWTLSSRLGVQYLASQAITLAVIVPINFVINRSFTFAAARPVATPPG